MYAAIDLDTKLILDVALFGRRDTDPAAAFLHGLTEKHGLSDAEFLIDSVGYLVTLHRLGLSGYLDYIDRSHIEKWFHTLKMLIDRFHNSWVGSRASVREWLEQFVHYYNTASAPVTQQTTASGGAKLDSASRTMLSLILSSKIALSTYGYSTTDTGNRFLLQLRTTEEQIKIHISSFGLSNEMTTIVVVRHGETTWNRKQRLQGWAPAPLTDLGQEQASQLGAALTERYDIDRILSSDLYRTEETVEILCEHVDAPVTFESAWRERDIGVYQGLPFDEMFERFPEYDFGETGPEAAHRRPESGESIVDVCERVIERWETTLDECESRETILIVTHGGPIRLLLGHLKDLDIVETTMEQSQGNCSINEFEFDHKTGVVRIVRENDTSHC